MYPMTALHFAVSWGDSQNTSSFSEVSGLTVEAEVVEYRGGADPQLSTRKMPGLKKFSNVTLKRGIAPAEAGNGLFDWYRKDFERGHKGYDSLQTLFARHAELLGATPQAQTEIPIGRSS